MDGRPEAETDAPSGPSVALTLVVPAYREAARIADSLRAIAEHVARGPAAEIRVVDDGSDDGTAEAVQRAATELPVAIHLLRYPTNRGKGHALKVGFASSLGERVAFTDADLSTPIAELDRLLAALDAGAGAAMGTRNHVEAEVRVPQPWHRIRLGSVFTRLVDRCLVRTSDVTCGFKAFRGEVGRDLFARLRADGWEYDAELLVIAERLGVRLEEVPVTWEHREGSKVRPLRDGLRSGLGLLRIARRARRDAYATPHPHAADVTVWCNPAAERQTAAVAR